MKRKIKGGDFFSGAGGFTTAFMLACAELGIRVEDFIAVNCWPRAIATHTKNYPLVRHFCRRVESLRVEDVAKGGRLHLLLGSPECTHHSSARGGKPMNDQSRSGAWHILDWASKLYIDDILLENVKEFRTWGPLGANGRPLKHRKGETYQAFLAALRALGYTVEDRIINAADFGEAQGRVRLFIWARRKGAIKWPKATTAKAHRSARDHVIDWTLKGQSIFERKRPLSEKTMKRIWDGLRRFGLKPFMVPASTGENRVRSVDAPMHTVTCNARGEALVQPFLLPKLGVMGHNQPRSIDQPLNTVVTDGRVHLVTPFLVEICHAGKRSAITVDGPLPTITCAHRGEIALCEPSLLPQQSGGALRPVSEPAPTVAAAGAVALIEPYLVEYYGTGTAASVDEALGTITTKPRFGLAQPEVVVDGTRYLLDIRFRMLQPHELAAAQGFPKDYIFTGNKTEQVRQIGNAVPVNLAKALIRAVLGGKAA